jgi:hypothetical protein
MYASVTILLFGLLGLITARLPIWRISKLDYSSFLIVFVSWFLALTILNLLTTDESLKYFYSNDQIVFLEATSSWIELFGSSADDLPIVLAPSLTLTAALLIAAFDLDPLSTLKGLNFLAYVILLRTAIYFFGLYSLRDSLSKMKVMPIFLILLFVGPSMFFFTLIGNRDVIISAALLIYAYLLYYRKSLLFAALMLVVIAGLRPHLAGAALMASLVVKNYPLRFISPVINISALVLLFTLVQMITSSVTRFFGFGEMIFKFGLDVVVERLGVALASMAGLSAIVSAEGMVQLSGVGLLMSRLFFADSVVGPFAWTFLLLKFLFSNAMSIKRFTATSCCQRESLNLLLFLIVLSVIYFSIASFI